MKRKSKFTAFILSAIPGLAHFYAGLAERALIFFMIFAGLLLGSVGLSVITNDGDFMAIFAVGYPLIWLVALIDSFSCISKINISQLYNNGEPIPENDQRLDKKTITLSLSIIPGAGHMYLGYQQKGLMIMAAFFFSVFFMGWLGISLLLFVLPLIWFYSFFDALHIVNGTKEEINDKEFELPKVKPEWIGYGLIAIGIVVIIERILYPLINYEIRRYIQTSIVSLIFILGGVYILNKNKTIIERNEVEDDDDHEDL